MELSARDVVEWLVLPGLTILTALVSVLWARTTKQLDSKASAESVEHLRQELAQQLEEIDTLRHARHEHAAELVRLRDAVETLSEKR